MPNASLSINQACCWALFLFHFSFFVWSTTTLLIWGSSATPHSMSSLWLHILAAPLNQLRGREGQKETGGGGGRDRSEICIYKNLSQTAAANVWASVAGVFHLYDKSLHYGGRSDSSAVLRLWDGPTGAQLRPAVLLIHHRVLRQRAAALTGHQKLD